MFYINADRLFTPVCILETWVNTVYGLVKPSGYESAIGISRFRVFDLENFRAPLRQYAPCYRHEDVGSDFKYSYSR